MGENHKTVIEKADPGAIDHGDGLVSFAIYAPYKESIHVIGSFNDWDRQRSKSIGAKRAGLLSYLLKAVY